jgi:hypothetical protein
MRLAMEINYVTQTWPLTKNQLDSLQKTRIWIVRTTLQIKVGKKFVLPYYEKISKTRTYKIGKLEFKFAVGHQAGNYKITYQKVTMIECVVLPIE